MRSAASIRVTLEPREDQACASSAPTGPAPRTIRLSGTSCEVVPSRLFQGLASASPSIGGIAAPLPVETITARLGDERRAVDLEALLAGEAAGAAEEPDALLLEPGELDGVIEVVDDLVAAREHRGGVDLAGDGLLDAGDTLGFLEQLAGAQEGLGRHAGVVGALAGDQVALDDRHREAAVGQASRGDLAGGPGADHDRVEALLAHRILPRFTK